MDFLVADDEDYVIENGDFAIATDSREQEARVILKSYPGNWKQFPLVGVGESCFVNGPINAELRRTVSLQLRGDGKRLRKLENTVDGLRIRVE